MRTKIGFNIANIAIEEVANEEYCIPVVDEKSEAILKMAIEISALMTAHSRAIISRELFSQWQGKKVLDKLDKIYIKYYDEV